jgi:hypothetical protein
MARPVAAALALGLLYACESEQVIGYNAELPIVDSGFVPESGLKDSGVPSEGSAALDAMPPPQDVAGSYTVSVVNGVNGCAFDNYQPGNTTVVPLTVTQQPDLATGRATFGSFIGIFYGFLVGSADYAIRVSGRSMDGIIVGKSTSQKDGCNVTYNAILSATVEGELIRGKVSFVSVPDGAPGCAKALCTSEQTFNGTRPPP